MKQLHANSFFRTVAFSASLVMLFLTHPGLSHADNHAGIPTEGALVAFWLTFGIVTVSLGIAFLIVQKKLKDSTWCSLPDALAEEAGNQGVLSAGQRPVMVASASRLIAFLGLLVLLTLFLGVGYSILWALFTGSALPKISDLTSFFLSGLALFAPYAFNQVKEALAAFGAP